MRPNDLSEAVEQRLASAERLATAAVRTMLASLPRIPSGDIIRVLDDVDRLFAAIDATESLIRRARTADDVSQALEYAEEAQALARLALDDASERVRTATDARAIDVKVWPPLRVSEERA